MSEVVKKKRIFYFDALRALAILSVIFVHVFMVMRVPLTGDISQVIISKRWLLTAFVINFFRIGVPLFLMLSGALSLGRDWTIKSFLGKRIPRIVGPFLFWGFVLSLMIIFASYSFGSTFYKTHDLYSILSFIYNAYLAKSAGFYAYWFFWMILGTYLIMPIFNKWVLHSDLHEVEYFLVFWIITCIFDFTLGYKFPVKLTYFVSPIGLVVLGYYLRHTQRKIFNNVYFGLFLMISMGLLMVILTYFLSDVKEIYNFDRYSIFVTLAVIGVFIFFKNWKFRILDKENILNKSISLVARYSYGMYLVHVQFMWILYHIIDMPYYPKTFLLLIGTIACSIIALAIFNRIPYVNEVIGVK